MLASLNGELITCPRIKRRRDSELSAGASRGKGALLRLAPIVVAVGFGEAGGGVEGDGGGVGGFDLEVAAGGAGGAGGGGQGFEDAAGEALAAVGRGGAHAEDPGPGAFDG